MKRKTVPRIERAGAKDSTGPVTSSLDRIDRAILSALQKDGRLTVTELADLSGLSRSPCWARLKRLEASGAIKTYVAVLDDQRLGVANFVFVEVCLERHDPRSRSQFYKALGAFPEIIEAHVLMGEYDYLLKVAVTGTQHYERFLRESLHTIKGFQRARSTFALSSVKRAISVDPLLFPRD